MGERLKRALRDVLGTARAAGRDTLLEHEALGLVGALGIGVPRHVVIGPGEDVPSLADFPGDRVVVKVLSPHVLHKSDVGGVAVVEKERHAIAAVTADMRDRFGDEDLHGFLVAEYVEHGEALGDELLLGMRITPDFGAVVTLGAGGVHAEFLAEHLAEGRDVAILTPRMRSDAVIDRALGGAAVAALLTEPQRGAPPRLAAGALAEVVGRFLDLADLAAAEGLAEFEVNPLVFAAGGPVALDALGRLGDAAGPPEPARPLASVDRLLRPATIAVAGVSARRNPGRIILENVLAAGFPAQDVLVIKPGAEEICGCRCVPDVASLPDPVDLLVLSVDARSAADAVADAVRLGRARSVILIPGGFGERSGSEGYAEQVRSVLRDARQDGTSDLVVNGPNCLGVRSVPGRYNTLFIPDWKLRFDGARPAPLAVLSQSGAFAVSWASKLGEMDPRYVITMGNQVDLTVGDYLTRLADDTELRVFACYVEGFRPDDGARFLDAAARITASGRTVLLYHAGRSAAGAQAMASHTASIAGDHAVCRALSAQAGVVVADGLQEFADLTRTFSLLDGRAVAGLRLASMSNAGFECVALADFADDFVVADLEPGTRDRLEAVLAEARLEDIVGVRNPLDVTPILPDAPFADAAEALLADPGVDVAVIGCVPLSGAIQTLPAGEVHAEDIAHTDSVVRRLAALRDTTPKAWVAVVDAGDLFDPMSRALDAAGIPTFRTADRALSVFGRYCRWRLRHDRTNCRSPRIRSE